MNDSIQQSIDGARAAIGWMSKSSIPAKHVFAIANALDACVERIELLEKMLYAVTISHKTCEQEAENDKDLLRGNDGGNTGTG